jgi:hypothetical protein
MAKRSIGSSRLLQQNRHLADGIVPAKGDTVTSELHDAFAIRYRVN